MLVVNVTQIKIRLMLNYIMISKLHSDISVISDDVSIQGECVNNSDHNFYLDEIRGEKTCIKCGFVLQTGCVSISLSIPRRFEKNTNYRDLNCVEFTGIENSMIRQTQNPNINECKNPALSRALLVMNKLLWSERKILIGLNQIKQICAENSCSDIVKHRAIFLFRQAMKHSSFRGAYIDLVAITCIIYASKSAQVPFNWQNIVQIRKYSENLTLKYFFKLTSSLKLPHIVPNPKLLIRSFCTDLRLPEWIVLSALNLVDLFSKNFNTGGLEPKGIAAASIYFACLLAGIHRSQKEISIVCRISELTLRSRLKNIQKVYHQNSSISCIDSGDLSPFF